MQEQLAARFEADRAHLRAVAYRMLGSASEADDAVQEAWLRLARSDTSEVENLTGWLTTVVARVSLTMLRSRARREEPVESLPEPATVPFPAGPEDETVLADSVGLALLVVLDTLGPAERLAFVLHDMFAVPFEEIASIVGRTPAAARQLASRARRRVQGAESPEHDISRRRQVVRAFLAASRGGDFAGLVALLDPSATLRSDDMAVRMGGNREVVGAEAVARDFSGRARDAQPALLDGLPGAVWAPRGKVRVAVRFAFDGDTVTGMELLADPDLLARLDITIED
jgi:RNA polymerase sigma-70 factor (ECF subfamily)